MRFRRTIMFLLCALLCLSSVSVYASPDDLLLSEETSQVPQVLRYTNIKNIIVGLVIKSDGSVLIECQVEARNCTSVKQEVKLQYWLNNDWRDVSGASWTKTDSGTSGNFADYSLKVGSGSYRVLDKITIYNGTTIVEQVEFPGNIVNR